MPRVMYPEGVAHLVLQLRQRLRGEALVRIDGVLIGRGDVPDHRVVQSEGDNTACLFRCDPGVRVDRVRLDGVAVVAKGVDVGQMRGHSSAFRYCGGVGIRSHGLPAVRNLPAGEALPGRFLPVLGGVLGPTTGIAAVAARTAEVGEPIHGDGASVFHHGVPFRQVGQGPRICGSCWFLCVDCGDGRHHG